MHIGRWDCVANFVIANSSCAQHTEHDEVRNARIAWGFEDIIAHQQAIKEMHMTRQEGTDLAKLICTSQRRERTKHVHCLLHSEL